MALKDFVVLCGHSIQPNPQPDKIEKIAENWTILKQKFDIIQSGVKVL
jgi:hypothetical protein